MPRSSHSMVLVPILPSQFAPPRFTKLHTKNAISRFVGGRHCKCPRDLAKRRKFGVFACESASFARTRVREGSLDASGSQESEYLHTRCIGPLELL